MVGTVIMVVVASWCRGGFVWWWLGFFAWCRGWVCLVMVVAEFSCGGLVFLIIFYEEEERQRERGERGEEKREIGGEINFLMNS